MINVKFIKLNNLGSVLPMVISILIAMAIVSGAVAELILSNMSLAGRNNDSQKALNIAEAGINYYLWHLSHNTTDYKDGRSTPTTPDVNLGYGPYVHTYIDDNARSTGTYTLWIKPQGSGSTVATVRSIGQVSGSSAIRTVEARIGVPSFASYSVLGDTALWFGNTEASSGPVHSNQGIRMDGASNDNITSANATYVPPSSLGGDGNSHPGVWCLSSVTTPVDCNSRSKQDWSYPVASIDFNLVSSSLCSLKKIAFLSDPSTASLASNNSTACNQAPAGRTPAYLPQRSSNGSFNIARGYLIQLNINGTYDLYYVNGENDRLTPYTTALTLQLVTTGVAIPSSGVIFAEDNVWVRTNPSFHGRVTIGAGRLQSSNVNAEIVIADDIVYSSKDGTDAIGLIAENDVTIAPYAPPSTGSFNFEVDAALIAQSGSVLYPSEYRTSSNTCTRGWVNSNQTFTFYGSVSSRQSWTWTWLFGNSSCGDAVKDPISNKYIGGIMHNTTQYDYNLLYTPPPSFPVTSTYNILSWREVLTKP